jgi:hypothetical protein
VAEAEATASFIASLFPLNPLSPLTAYRVIKGILSYVSTQLYAFIYNQ